MTKMQEKHTTTIDPAAYRGAELRALADEAGVSLKTAYRWRQGKAGRHTTLLIERVIQSIQYDDQQILSPSTDRNGR